MIWRLMTGPADRYGLPEGLPIPEDDGAGDHLRGARVPAVVLPSTGGSAVLLDRVAEERGAERSVVFCYPRAGTPDDPPPPGWDDIPGARGCTPESCAFRDNHDAFVALGCVVFGLSTQSVQDQLGHVARHRLPYEVLSDERLELTGGLRLPTFSAADRTLIKRLTLIVAGGVIEHVFYPVFPPDRHPDEVLTWLRAQGAASPAS
jgi:peroxiredoxin